MTSSDCSSAANQSQGWVPVWDTSRNRYYPSPVHSSALLANLGVDSWVEWENPETSAGRRSIESAYEEGVPTSVERTIVAMIVVEDLTEGSRTADPFLEAREGDARFCGEGSSTKSLEDVARNRGRPYGEGLEWAESPSVNETPDKVLHRPKRARELALCSSCSSSGSRCLVVEVGRGEPESSTYSWAE